MTAQGPRSVPTPVTELNRPSPLVVWCFFDGKRGHENQSRGLIAALRRRARLDVHYLPAYRQDLALWHWLRRRFPLGERLPDPEILIGAGHATHMPLLAAQRQRGGKSIVLMNPSLPRRCFDLCVLPEHDAVPANERVFVSRGALSPVRALRSTTPDRGLILIGGPSDHYGWSDDRMVAQIAGILAGSTDHWTVSTSRRTPPSFTPALRQSGLLDSAEGQRPKLKLVPWSETTTEWLPRQLAVARSVWVSEDSVSMVYDGLTAGVPIGLLEVPRLKKSRVARGMDRLVQEAIVTTYSQWRSGHELHLPPGPFNEADRCADWILGRWYGQS